LSLRCQGDFTKHIVALRKFNFDTGRAEPFAVDVLHHEGGTDVLD
jgi:hypothetical protein